MLMQPAVNGHGERESLFLGGSSAWPVLRCIFALALLANFAGFMMDVPMVQLLEQAVCRDYYRTTYLHIDQQSCKVEPVQSALASLSGWQRFFTFIPGLLTAYFFGGLADKYGRKPIASLAFTGEVLAIFWTPFVCYFHNVFPTKLVWMSSAFYFLGGGSRVLTSVIFTMITDVLPAKQRSTVMYYFSTAVAVTSLTGPPVGAWILKNNIWLPFELSFVLYLICYPVLLFLPETLRPQNHAEHVTSEPSNENSPLLNSDAAPQNHAEHVTSETSNENSPLLNSDAAPQNYAEHVTSEPSNENSPLLNSDATPINHSSSTFFSVLASFNIIACLSIFFLRMFAAGASQFLLQYMSKRFSAPLYTFGWVSPLTSGGSIAVNGLLLPVIIQYLARCLTPQQINLSIVRASLFLATASAVVIGVGVHPALTVIGLLIQALSSGLDPSLLSLAASFVQRNHTARLYTVTAVIEATAGMISGPVMASVFVIGLNSGSGVGMGACFFLGAAGYAVAMWSSFGIRVLEMVEVRRDEDADRS